MNGRVLVIVRSVDEVELARAFVGALGDTRCFLLFGLEDLRTRFGETAQDSSIDIATFFLHPEDICLAVCFGSARELSATNNLFLLSYLNDVGIATLEVQRDLLQDCVAAAKSSAARHFLCWSESGGVGNLRAALPRPEQTFVREDVVLVSSRLDGDVYSEEERHRFTFAVMRLAREQPDVCFLWRPSGAESQQADVAPYWAMLEKLGPKNLFLEESESFASLLARASAVIAMASNVLLDCAEARKPALVFSARAAAPAPTVRAKMFASYAELAPQWRELRAAPSTFQIQSDLPFDRARLLQYVEELSATSQLNAAWLSIALRYLGNWQEARGRADIGRLQGSVAGVERRITSLTEGVGKLASNVDKLLERVGVLHRSTVAYKAMRLVARVRKGSSKG